jgi:hypothetical protein
MKKIRITQILLLIALSALWTPSVFSSEPGTLLLQKSFPVQSDRMLKVNSYTGNVKVDCWEKNVIEIRIYGSPEAGKYLDFNVSSDGNGVKIAALKKTEVDNINDLGLRYEINVPSDYTVKVDGGKKVTIDKHSLPVDIEK